MKAAILLMVALLINVAFTEESNSQDERMATWQKMKNFFSKEDLEKIESIKEKLKEYTKITEEGISFVKRLQKKAKPFGEENPISIQMVVIMDLVQKEGPHFELLKKYRDSLGKKTFVTFFYMKYANKSISRKLFNDYKKSIENHLLFGKYPKNNGYSLEGLCTPLIEKTVTKKEVLRIIDLLCVRASEAEKASNYSNYNAIANSLRLMMSIYVSQISRIEGEHELPFLRGVVVLLIKHKIIKQIASLKCKQGRTLRNEKVQAYRKKLDSIIDEELNRYLLKEKAYKRKITTILDMTSSKSLKSRSKRSSLK